MVIWAINFKTNITNEIGPNGLIRAIGKVNNTDVLIDF